LTYMLMDADRVAASPATVYRVLKQAGCFQRWSSSCASRCLKTSTRGARSGRGSI
jgi:hypothetical protein